MKFTKDRFNLFESLVSALRKSTFRVAKSRETWQDEHLSYQSFNPNQCRGGEIGRRTGLKILGFRKGRTGSIPVLGTTFYLTS